MLGSDVTGLPRSVLEHPDSEYHSDTLRGVLADQDETFRLYNRGLYYDLPQAERFRSNEKVTNYEDTDDDIDYDTYRRQARGDLADGHRYRHYDNRALFEARRDRQLYGNVERGDHITIPRGQSFGK